MSSQNLKKPKPAGGNGGQAGGADDLQPNYTPKMPQAQDGFSVASLSIGGGKLTWSVSVDGPFHADGGGAILPANAIAIMEHMPGLVRFCVEVGGQRVERVFSGEYSFAKKAVAQ